MAVPFPRGYNTDVGPIILGQDRAPRSVRSRGDRLTSAAVRVRKEAA
ncbi:hypothetical protein [Sporisorium scitamineum]|uniref:Uncharacterized protein n=1 Tax=Sporisorium scitamineum TaxID=49012 RepID=A0A0F7S1F0_9BASI|nr:hypothetical protein [Sporisorium scitamineum]